jgi:hypothetical protein
MFLFLGDGLAFTKIEFRASLVQLRTLVLVLLLVLAGS